MIAHGPLHRSGRAELPHPAPTLGDNAQALERIGMANTSQRKPTHDVAPHTAPRQVVALAAVAQHQPPQPAHCLAERAQRRSVHVHSVITEMTQQDRPQVPSLVPNGRVHASPQVFFQSPQLSLPPLTHRLSQYREVPFPSFSAAMRETQDMFCKTCPRLHPHCGQGWKSGKFFVVRKTIRTRLLAKLKQVKAALRRRMHQPLAEVGNG